ncbi:exodeoxyribonuclease V subunit alpha [Pseudaquabacterium rugosum]|uniref:RecBCD enzyme subunit RecD n=1 Tax=Pseudaquabacterium rugosum TaxID=2984194 RepID=A0ABU9BDN3_9BURK
MNGARAHAADTHTATDRTRHDAIDAASPAPLAAHLAADLPVDLDWPPRPRDDHDALTDAGAEDDLSWASLMDEADGRGPLHHGDPFDDGPPPDDEGWADHAAMNAMSGADDRLRDDDDDTADRQADASPGPDQDADATPADDPFDALLDGQGGGRGRAPAGAADADPPRDAADAGSGWPVRGPQASTPGPGHLPPAQDPAAPRRAASAGTTDEDDDDDSPLLGPALAGHGPALGAEALAIGLGWHLRQWSLAAGADARSAQAAAQAGRRLSRALADGHVCLQLDRLPPLPDGAHWRDHLLASRVCGRPQDAATQGLPLVLDDAQRLYLQRQFDQEQRLATRLMAASRAPALAVPDAVAHQLRALFAPAPGRTAPVPDWQQVAAALALRQRIVVVSGGPGTGKTTTVVNLLACVLTQQPDARVALAAPTGKAAARMTEAVRQRASGLPEHLRALLPTDSYTIHRLLGVNPMADGGFTHHAGHRLPLDLLVIDEASMLDLSLATRLLEAVPESARVILLGDKDQLAAVDSGAVFAELSASPHLGAATTTALDALCGLAPGTIRAPSATTDSPLQDMAVWFTQNFRFAADSGIGRIAREMRDGQADALVDGLRSGADPSVRWIEDAQPQPAAAVWQAIEDGLAPLFALAATRTPDPQALTAQFDRFRVLCAVREGERGMAAVNARMTRLARERLGAADRQPQQAWYPGRPVMVLRNDPVLRLFNGDTGLCAPDADGQLMVWFPRADGQGLRAVPPLRLPEHQSAYAMTVHKSQGSEFDAVLVLLPERPTRVLSRELVYTAVTRAKRAVCLAGPEAVLRAAVASPTRRHSGLLARLREQVLIGRPE